MKKRLLCLMFSIVMAAGLTILCNAGNVSADGLKFIVNSVDANRICISSTDVDRIYTDVQIGNKKPVTEMYKLKNGGVNIDISYLKGKQASVKVYARNNDSNAVTVKVDAQPKKIKGKFDAKTGVMTVTVNGSPVDGDKVICRIGRKERELSQCKFTNYYAKGVTAYVSVKGTDKQENITEAGSLSFTPASKEAKVKIPARGKGPSIVIDPDNLAISVPKNCVISVTNGNTTVSESVVQAKVFDIKKFVSGAGIDIATPVDRQTTSNAAIIEVYYAATAAKLQSKTTEVIVPWQPILDPALLNSTDGISYEPYYNSSKTKQTGIKVDNKTSETFHVAILGKDRTVDDIDLLEKDAAKKLIWCEVKPKRSRVITGDRVVSGAFVVYRIRGVVGVGDKAKLASTIVADQKQIKVMEPIKNDSTIIEVSNDYRGPEQEITTTSCTALSVRDVSGGVSYHYVVKDKSITGVKLGYKLEDLQRDYASDLKAVDRTYTQIQVQIKEGQWIIVFVLDAENNVMAYSSKQVTKSDIYN